MKRSSLIRRAADDFLGRMGTKRVFNEWRKDISGHRQCDYVYACAVGAISLTVFMLLPVLGSCHVIRLVCGVTASTCCCSGSALALHGGLFQCHDQPPTRSCVGHYRASLNQTRTSKARASVCRPQSVTWFNRGTT